jgi:hypothetical protein
MRKLSPTGEEKMKVKYVSQRPKSAAERKASQQQQSAKTSMSAKLAYAAKWKALNP